MCKNNCNECQGELIPPVCVVIDSEKYENLDKFSVDVEKRLDKLEEPHKIDIKTLNSNKKLSKDEIIQLLIDEIIALKSNTVTPTVNICPGIDWKNNCTSCNANFCASLQAFINTMTIKTS